VEVNVLEEATAEIIGPIFTCTNSPVDIQVTTNGEGEWSVMPANSGVIDDPNASTTMFTPNLDFYSSTTLVLEWITFDPDEDGPCNAFTTNAEMEVFEIPFIELDESFEIDCGDEIGAMVYGGFGPNYTYSWSPEIGIVDPSSNPSSVNAAGEYTLTVTDNNGCSNSDSTSVVLNELDQMAAANNAVTCLNAEISLTGYATMGESPYTYQWTPNDHLIPSDGESAEVIFLYNDINLASDSVFTLSFLVTDAFGCTDNQEVEVLVHPLPVVYAGPDTALCQYGSPFYLMNYSPLDFEGESAGWSPSNIVVPESLNVGANTFEYSFTDFNSCTNTDQMTVTIHEVPNASFIHPDEACENEPVLFTNTSTCATCGPLYLDWDFNGEDESNAFAPTHTFSDTGLVQIELGVISVFGCADAITEIMNILALPETSFEISETGVCGPADITINNTTIGAGLQYEWNIEPFGLVQEAEPGTMTFPAAPCDSIFYEVYLTTTNICGSTFYEDSLLVYSLAQPNFVLSSDTICSEEFVEISNSTVCAWMTTYSWDLGDGTTPNSQDEQISNIYTAWQDFTTYEIELIATNPCGVVSNTQELVVVPLEIEATFDADPIIGCEPLEVSFDQEMFGVTYFSWDFNDGIGSAAEDPVHTFEVDGSYLVEFVAGNFCGAEDTAYLTMTVLPSPEIFFMSTEQFLCVGEETQFIPMGDPIIDHSWSFGDGTSSNLVSPTHVYGDEGEYEVTLEAISALNGCPNSTTVIIEVITTPTAEIIADETIGCPPFTVSFSNSSTDAINYFWNLGDNNLFIGDSLTHTYQNSGNYTVEVIAINGNSCVDTATVDIIVYPQPIADFQFEVENNTFHVDVNFENNSQYAVAYQWAFGDGTIGYGMHPIHSYEKTGNCEYYPQLIAFNTFGCTDTTYRTISIPLEMSIWAPNAFTPDNNGINDVFYIVTSDVEPSTSRLAIFNRWGTLIHEDTGVNPSWNGYIDGKLAKNDLYVWQYYGREKCNQEEVNITGHVTLIK
jgi:gliding motility-associated-like protein